MNKNKRIFLSPPHMSGQELQLIHDAFDSNYIAPLGPQVDAFEKEFCGHTGFTHCVALNSGTSAMHLALRFLGIGPGDEVIASTLTFIGSISPVTFLGAKPVFIDCDNETWNMNTGLLEEELASCNAAGRSPKAVVPTDLYGQCCDLERIVEICDRYSVPVVCDSAEAMGAWYYTPEVRGQRSEIGTDQSSQSSNNWRHAGRGARAAVFSFNGNKIITTSGGGMLASDDKDLIEKARFWSQQARDPSPHYEHTEIGYNYRMSNILAAIGRGQLRILDERVKKKREIFEYYKNALKNLPGISFMPEAAHGRSTRWLTVILIDPKKFGADRETVRLALESENIESRPVWKPMHLQPVFQKTGIGHGAEGRERGYPCRVVGGEVSEFLFEHGLCLPSGTAMTEVDLERVIRIIRKNVHHQ